MRCPGVYPPDPTLGITDPQMLPPPKLVSRSRNYEHRPCPRRGKSCPRDRIFTRTLHDLGEPAGGRPRDIRLTPPYGLPPQDWPSLKWESYNWQRARRRPMRKRPGPDQIAAVLRDFQADL